MKKLVIILLVILVKFYPIAGDACVDLPIDFKVAGSSFADEVLSLKKSNNGAIVNIDGNELYFNHKKNEWCNNYYSNTKNQETCLTGNMQLKLPSSKDKNISVAIIELSEDKKNLLIKSITNGKVDSNLNYLKITDGGILKNDLLKAKITAEIIGPNEAFFKKAELNAPPITLKSDGSVAYIVFRGFFVKNKSENAGPPSSCLVIKAGCGIPTPCDSEDNLKTTMTEFQNIGRLPADTHRGDKGVFNSNQIKPQDVQLSVDFKDPEPTSATGR